MGKRGSVRMVGRDDELADCLQVLDEVDEGLPSTVLILGEAGLGKSTLSRAVADEARQRGGLVLTSHGLNLDGGEIPYGLVSEVLRDVSRQLGTKTLHDLLDEGLSALSPLAPRTSVAGEQVDRALVLPAVASLLERLAERQQVCWWIEDLQWVDRSSLDIVRYVSRTAEASRLLLLATIRTDPDGTHARELDELVHDPDVETLRLHRLDPTESRRLVTELTRSHDLSPAQIDRIITLGDGIPFFVEELTRTSPGHLPSSLTGLMADRVDSLDEPSRDLLAAVAVAGRSVEIEDLVAVVERSEDEVGRALEACVRGGQLEVTDTKEAGFRHALLADAVLRSLLPQSLRSWHRRWAQLLDGHAESRPGDSDLVFARARHWFASGDAVTAIARNLDAATAAHSADALVEEAEHWRRVHELWREAGSAVNTLPVTHQDVIVAWYLAAHRAGDYPSLPAVLDAARLAPDLQDDWLVTLFLKVEGSGDPELNGWTAAFLDDDELAQILSRFRSLPPSLMASFTLLGLLDTHGAKHPDIAETAHSTLQAVTPPDTDELMSFHVRSRGVDLALARADWDEAFALMRAGVDAGEFRKATTQARALAGLAAYLWLYGRCSEALDVIGPVRAAIPGGSQHQAPRAEILLRSWAALLLSEAGNWAAALDEASRTIKPDVSRDDVLRSVGRLIDEGKARIALTRIALRQGRIDDAQATKDPWDPGISEFQLAWNVVHPRVEIAAHLGEREEVRELGARLWNLPVAPDVAPLGLFTLLAAGRGLLEPPLGEVDPDDLTLVEQRTVQFTYPGAFASAMTAELDGLALQARGEATSATWQDVVDTWVVVGHPYDEALNRIRLAAALASEGHPEDATGQLHAAQQIADALPSPVLADKIMKVARVHGLRIRSTAPVAQGAGPLTGREHEVLGLITEGLSNQEIADRLFMSPKTASVHVSRIITKLGVRNRTEAATLAQRTGLLAETQGDQTPTH